MLTHQFALLAALAGAPPTSPATSAGPERLAVLPVLLAADGHASARQVFDAVASASRLRPGLRVMSIDDYYFHEGQALAKRALACGADTACMAKALGPFDARLGLVVIVNGELDPPLVSLMLLDGEDGQVAAQWAGQVEGAVLERVEAEAATQLEGQGFLQWGRLVVDVTPGTAELVVDEDIRPDLGTSNTFTLPPGPHAVRAVAEDHAPGEVVAEVRAGEEARAVITLQEATSIVSSPWLWIGVGAAVVGAAAATAVAVSSGGGDACFCVQTKGMGGCGGCP